MTTLLHIQNHSTDPIYMHKLKYKISTPKTTQPDSLVLLVDFFIFYLKTIIIKIIKQQKSFHNGRLTRSHVIHNK